MAKRKVPFVNLPKQYKEIGKEVNIAIEKVLKNGRYILGSEVEKLESELSKFIGTKYAIGVASGTDALTIALKSLDLGKGDDVVVPANAYPTAFGVSLSGAKVQLADVDKDSLNVSIDTIKKAVTKKTKAIVLVHLYGNPVDMAPILKFAKSRKIFVIEDCAQSIGALYKNKKVGSFGDVSCFSFYPTKNLGAFGDGGAILTNKKNIYEKTKLWRMYGERGRYNSVLIGQNSRLDELQAAILRVKLRKLNSWNNKRRKLASVYKDKLGNLPIEIVKETNNSKSVYHLFVIKTKKRNKLVEYLAKENVATGIHYPIPIHKTKSFSNLSGKKFPVSEMASKEIVSLPIYPEMEEGDVKYITDKVREFIS